MRVLYLCHRIPFPPNKGDKIRAYRELRAIGERHEVDLFTLADCAEDLEGELALRRYCRTVTVAGLSRGQARLRMLSTLWGGKPLSNAYFYSPELDVKLHNALLRRSYDRIFVYCSSMAQYVRGIRDVPAVVDFVDVDSDKWMQYSAVAHFPLSAVYRREARCLRDYERRLCKRYPAIVVTTEREAQLIRHLWEKTHVHVVANGVDTAYFDPADSMPESSSPEIVFTGDMGYFPNQQAVAFFARSVLPLVRRAVPNAHFSIVGRNPSRSVLRLRKIDAVTVTGSVRDIRPYLAKARVCVAPFSIAAGIQNKILEAMAYARPVVATPRAVQGLVETVADVIDVGETAEELADLVASLLREPNIALRKGLQGRQRVAAEYNWDRSLARLLDLLKQPHAVGRSREAPVEPPAALEAR